MHEGFHEHSPLKCTIKTYIIIVIETLQNHSNINYEPGFPRMVEIIILKILKYLILVKYSSLLYTLDIQVVWVRLKPYNKNMFK